MGRSLPSNGFSARPAHFGFRVVVELGWPILPHIYGVRVSDRRSSLWQASWG